MLLIFNSTIAAIANFFRKNTNKAYFFVLSYFTTPSRKIIKTFVVFIKIIIVFICVATVFCLFFYFSLLYQISIVRVLAGWLCIFLLVYWILAAVWCLYDKDDYGRNVSASDDFYNIAFSALWLVEGFLLSLFLSYTKLFDFYDSFLESEELEQTFLNEDADGSELLHLLFSFLTIQFVLWALDMLLLYETLNPLAVVFFLIVTVIWLIVYFTQISVQFIEEFDFEEQMDDIFDEEDNLFEHEDFVDEGFDGGDYAEGYEILQLFFSYWHYLFICLHVVYLTYNIFAAKGKQTHVYWGVIAICQNITLILILDFLDWGEVLLFLDNTNQTTIYNWFYISEEPSVTLELYWSIVKQYLEFFIPLDFRNLNKSEAHNNYQEIINLYIEVAKHADIAK